MHTHIHLNTHTFLLSLSHETSSCTIMQRKQRSETQMKITYSPQAGHLWSSFREWWGDSLTLPRLDISGHRSANGGEILLLAPGWTSPVVVRRMVGRFSSSTLAGHLWSSFGARWGDSLTRPRLDISGRRSARGGEILLLAPGWNISGHRLACVGAILSLSPG